MSFFEELKRRKVLRTAGIYAGVGWLIIQLAIALEAALNLPPWFDTTLTVIVMLGVPFALLFAWSFEFTPNGIERTPPLNPDEDGVDKRHRNLYLAIVCGVGLVLSAVGFQAINSTSSMTSVQKLSKVSEASIAVLPFADLSADKSQEYFGDGIAEELLNTLAKFEEMKVAGRTSSFAFKDKNEDLREIGRILNVAHILEGSIRKSGNKIRVTAQLIKVDDGFHLWSETYDRDLNDIFAVQDDISRDITFALIPHIVGEDAQLLQNALRTDVSAYEKFLQARDLARSRNRENLEEARILLSEVIAIDQGYAPAFALQAKVSLLLSNGLRSYGTTPVGEAIREANSLIDSSQKIEPDLGSAHAARGLGLSMAGEKEAAIVELKRAVELNPNDLEAINWLANEYRDARRYLEAADLAVDLFEKDPLYPPAGSNAVVQLSSVGDIDRAQAIVERLELISPDLESTERAKAFLPYLQGKPGTTARLLLDMYERNPAPLNGVIAANNVISTLSEYEPFKEYDLPAYYHALGSLTDGDCGNALSGIQAAQVSSPDDRLIRNEYIRFLLWCGKTAEITPYFEENWGSVPAFAESVGGLFSGNYGRFAELAFVFRETGETKLYDETMRYWRRSIDLDLAGGLQSIFEQEALYSVLVGDESAAVISLEREFEQNGFISMTRFENPLLEPLNDNLDFQELRERALVKMNHERAIAGFGLLEE